MGFLPYTTTLLHMAGGGKYLAQGRADVLNPGYYKYACYILEILLFLTDQDSQISYKYFGSP